MKLDMNNPKAVQMFNSTYARACWHHKHRVRKKNYARAQYMLRKWCQIPRKEWKKHFKR